MEKLLNDKISDNAMKDFLSRKLNLYDHERRTCQWAVLLFFFIFFFLGIFRSYVDATFLKRYGAEQIPVMLLINGVLTVALFHLLSQVFRPVSDVMLTAGCMILCAVLIAILYFMVLKGTLIAYPLLFQLMNIQDSFFLVYLWNIAADMFDARQGKRIFPLITAGQVLGAALGSMIVAPLASVAGYNSPLVIVAAGYFLIGTVLAGVASHGVPLTEHCRKTPEQAHRKPGEMIALVREYPIIRYLLVNAFIPNLLLPVFTYQFAVIAQNAFHSERALLTFIGVFRGVSTLLAFLLMLVMGKLYTRIGLTKASFFHPVNFLAVFAGLGASFHIAVAAYGQFSVLTIQRAIAGPINKVVFNLVPKRIARWSRIFIGGTVIKTSMIVSALGMVFLKKFFPARDLAFPAALLALYWIYETGRFYRCFRTGLKQTLMDQSIDYSQVETGLGIPYHISFPESLELDMNAGMLDNAFLTQPGEALERIDDPDEIVRAQAISAISGSDEVRAINRLMERLTDVGVVRRAAIDCLSYYGSRFQPFFEAVLANAPLRMQQGIIEAMRLSGKKHVPLAFIGQELEKIYHAIAMIEILSEESPSPSTDMLITHLKEVNEDSLKLIFQAMRIGNEDIGLIYEALRTDRAAVAAELLESILQPEITGLLMPLIENISSKDKMMKGRRLLCFRKFGNLDSLLFLLGESPDPTTRMLTAFVVGEHAPEPFYYPTIERLLNDLQENVRQTAAYAMKKITGGDTYMPEIIFNMNILKKTPLFDGMTIRALEAVGAIVRQRFYKAGDIVIRERDPIDALFCIINGRLDLYVQYGHPGRRVVRTLSEGAIFGERSLFTHHPAAETHVVASDFMEVYVIDHEYIRELMNIYPQIGVNMARFFALQLESA